MAKVTRIGYARVSTKDQELGLDAQKQQLLDYGVNEEHVFVDKGTSGTINAQSPVMEKLLSFVEAQDGTVEVVVSKLDRWGRDPEDVVEGIKKLERIGGCFTSLAEGISMVTPNSSIGMLIIRIMGAIAAMERERIAERTRDSLAELRKRGVPLGPPPKLTSKDVAWIKEQHEVFGLGAQRITKALPIERNVTVSKYTVLKVLGMVSRAKPYVPNDNHKYVAREATAAARLEAKKAA